jgi:hypothetical protein
MDRQRWNSATNALTQTFSRARRPWIALLILPALGHAGEFIVHWSAGTPRLGASVAASVAFSVLTTSFNVFAMRRGALVVGDGAQSLLSDLRRLPRLFASFAVAGARIPATLLRAWRRRKRKRSRITRRVERHAAVSAL